MLQLVTTAHRAPQGSKIEKDIRVYRNTVTGVEVVTYHIYTDRQKNKWWTFEDLYALPFIRQLAAKKIIDLYGHGLALADILSYVNELKALVKSADPEKYEKAYAKLLELETLSTSTADPVKQCIGLCTVYILHDTEHPDAYTNDLQNIKMTTLSLDIDAQSFFLSWWTDVMVRSGKLLSGISQIVSSLSAAS